MIDFKEVHIGYSKPLITVSGLTLHAGELYILAGKNGIGKSTLLKSICHQIPLIKGTVEINERPLNILDLSKTVAFVNSTFPIVEYLKTEDFIALGRSPYTNAFGRLKPSDLRIIDEVCDQLNINSLKGKYTSELSDGERQLVAIAKALAQETPVVILDEPTAFLDYSNKLIVLIKLKEIAKKLNKCVLLSSHDIDLGIEANCTFLVITAKEKRIQQLNAPVNKDELLELGFL